MFSLSIVAQIVICSICLFFIYMGINKYTENKKINTKFDKVRGFFLTLEMLLIFPLISACGYLMFMQMKSQKNSSELVNYLLKTQVINDLRFAQLRNVGNVYENNKTQIIKMSVYKLRNILKLKIENLEDFDKIMVNFDEDSQNIKISFDGKDFYIIGFFTDCVNSNLQIEERDPSS